MKITHVIVLLVMAMISGCASDAAYKDVFTIKTFSAPLRQKLQVPTGDVLFVDGAIIEGEVINIASPVEKMIPGSMFIPFPIRIESGGLEMTTVTSRWKYYCADNGKATASFPGLGSVIREGDCVGIRISHDGQEHEWAVNNSNYNRGWGETIWTLSMNDEETKTYLPKTSSRPFKVKELKRITFDGYYGGQLHFTWEDIASTGKNEKSFIFDFSGKPTEVGVKGNHFIVYEADNTKLVYEWVHFKGTSL